MWPGCGYALKCCVPASSQKDASIHKGLPSREVTQAASPQGGWEAGEASGRKDEHDGKWEGRGEARGETWEVGEDFWEP